MQLGSAAPCLAVVARPSRWKVRLNNNYLVGVERPIRDALLLAEQTLGRCRGYFSVYGIDFKRSLNRPEILPFVGNQLLYELYYVVRHGFSFHSV